MYCTNCGKEIAEGSAFCTYCGERVELPVAQEAPNDPFAPKQPSSPAADSAAAKAGQDVLGTPQPSAATSAPQAVEQPSAGAAPKPKTQIKLDKKVITGAIIAVAIVLGIIVGVNVAGRLMSSTGSWYAYADNHTLYEMTLSKDNSGHSDEDGSFTWKENSDFVSVDGEAAFDKENGTLVSIDTGLTYYKDEAKAEADYQSRLEGWKQDYESFKSTITEALKGTWEYDGYSSSSTLVIDDGTWKSSSQWTTGYFFSTSTQKGTANGTWNFVDLDDEYMYDYSQYASIDFHNESADSSDPVSNVTVRVSHDENYTPTVYISGWEKVSDEVKGIKTASKSSGESGSYDLTVKRSNNAGTLSGTVNYKNGYVIAKSSTKKYTLSQLKEMNLSDAELCVAWNEPYARAGYIFGNQGLNDYFCQFDWYNKIKNKTTDQSKISLSSAARANVKSLQSLLSNSSWLALDTTENH